MHLPEADGKRKIIEPGSVIGYAEHMVQHPDRDRVCPALRRRGNGSCGCRSRCSAARLTPSAYFRGEITNSGFISMSASGTSYWIAPLFFNTASTICSVTLLNAARDGKRRESIKATRRATGALAREAMEEVQGLHVEKCRELRAEPVSTDEASGVSDVRQKCRYTTFPDFEQPFCGDPGKIG